MPNGDMLGLLEGLGPAIVVLIATLLARYLQSQRRELTYKVELMPVFRVRQGFDGLMVRYGGILVENLYSCRVVMRNSGNVALSNRPLPIELKGNVTVLEERFETIPGLECGEKGEIGVDDESGDRWRHTYRVEWLNPGEEMSVGLIVAGDLALSDIAIPARGGGLKCLRDDSCTSRRVLRKVLHSAVWMFLGTGCLVVLIGLKSESTAILWRGLIPAVLSYAVLRLVDRLRSPRKRLSYRITSPRPVFTVIGSPRKKVSVEYKGMPVKDLYTCRVVLQNAGNRSLENQIAVVRLGGANILESSIHTEPELEYRPVGLDDDLGKDRRKYHFSELEPGDRVTIDLTFEGKITLGDVKVDARGEMLKVEPEREGDKLIARVTAAAVSLWLFNLSALFLLAVLFLLPRGFGIVDALHEWGYLIYDWLVGVSAEPGFWSGAVVGMAGLAIAAFVLFQVNEWWAHVTAPIKPQKLARTTDRAEVQLVGSSALIFIVGVLVLVCIVCLLIELLIPGTLQRVLQTLTL